MHDDTFLTALTGHFDAHEEQLRAVALRITGSPAEAEEALAEARAALGRDEDATVRAWLTATVGRACVRRLQERGRRDGGAGGVTGVRGRGRDRGRERGPGWDGGAEVHGAGEPGRDSGAETHRAGEPGRDSGTETHRTGGPGRYNGAEIHRAGEPGWDSGAETHRTGEPGRDSGAETHRTGRGDRGHSGGGSDGVGSLWLALLVMLERLGGEERLAYVLHDVFGLSVSETARVIGGSPEGAARLARRARERMRGGGAARTEGERERQGVVVARFLAAARARDVRALVAVLDPEVVAYAEGGPVHGVAAVAETAAVFARRAEVSRPALVEGAVGRSASRPAGRSRRSRPPCAGTGSSRSPHHRGGPVRALDLAFPDS
ncbi:sigma factor-like helix-turn-helix DNA-binding protein [Streptomyces diastatochromogenes]|nr:sigma factor-like helix-turn-helix DNA-binding protein [Streptomyces diastatochromogenes]